MIPTFVSKAEAAELAIQAFQCTVLELGTQWGYSCLEMAETAELVVTVDWHMGDSEAGEMDTLPGFVSNYRARHGRGNLVPVVGRIEQVLPLLRPWSFDMLFHDAAHDADSVRQHLALALPLVRPSGVVAIHDWGLFGVQAAAEPILGPPPVIVGRLALWRLWPGRWDSVDARPGVGERG